jgi:hypothetical protein
MSREPQNREEEFVSADLHCCRVSGSASSAAVVERRHLLYDDACADETIQFNLRRAVVAMGRRPCWRLRITYNSNAGRRR